MSPLQGIGIGLVALAILSLIVWVVQNGKAGKIKSVPFKKPSEIAQQGANAGDAKQMVSTEGQVNGQPIAAPMSGQPGLYYEIEVTRGFHTMSKNAQGQSTKNHGTKSMLSRKEGTFFNLTDGSGSIGVDCTKAPSMDLKQSHRNRVQVGVAVASVQFGSVVVEAEGLASNVAGMILGGEQTDYFEGVERIVPFVPGQRLYALGKLASSQAGLAIGPTGWGALMLSDQGREGALGAAAKTAKIALIAGVVSMLAGGVCAGLGFVVFPEAGHDKSASAAPPPKAAPAPAARKK